MASGLIDSQKIATDLSQRAIDRALVGAERIIRDYWAKYRNRDATAYADYLIRRGMQANAVRNFIYDNRSAALYDIYVPTMISYGDLSGDKLIEQLCGIVKDPKKRRTAAFGIVGTAGAGKSLFMKHAFFKIQTLEPKRIPVLVEVRTFNRLPLASLERRIFDDFVALGCAISMEQILNGLKIGLFAVLLDGMDELKGSIQSHYAIEARDFIMRFPLCPILVSSRPTQRLRSLEMDIRPIAPLSLSAADNLINRLDFDGVIKAGFLRLLHDSLFRTHREFASVPLLCTIMLITFSDTGRIANSRHEFFEDAFVALWSKHDGRKGDFKRHRYTTLSKNEFLKLLSAFAISSYSGADYDMRPMQFSRHLDAAMRLSGIRCNEEDFERDLTVSTSLALLDGPYIRFCHRSFQEYFSAVFIAASDDDSVGELIEDLSDRIDTDNVLPLVLSINSEKIERNWVMPKFEQLSSVVVAASTDIQKYAKVALGEAGERSDIATAMHKIRMLYQFDPSTATLRSAYDAGYHMNVSLSRLTQGTSSKSGLLKGGVFMRDKNNFQTLADALKKKHHSRSVALEGLLRRAGDLNHNEAKIDAEGE